MRIPDVIYDYWEFILGAILLVAFFPTAPSALANMNLAIWWIVVLCFVHELDNTRRKIKNGKAYWMMELTPKKRRRFSTDALAWMVFSVAVVGFFAWLVVFA